MAKRVPGRKAPLAEFYGETDRDGVVRGVVDLESLSTQHLRLLLHNSEQRGRHRFAAEVRGLLARRHADLAGITAAPASRLSAPAAPLQSHALVRRVAAPATLVAIALIGLTVSLTLSQKKPSALNMQMRPDAILAAPTGAQVESAPRAMSLVAAPSPSPRSNRPPTEIRPPSAVGHFEAPDKVGQAPAAKPAPPPNLAFDTRPAAAQANTEPPVGLLAQAGAQDVLGASCDSLSAAHRAACEDAQRVVDQQKAGRIAPTLRATFAQRGRATEFGSPNGRGAITGPDSR